MLYNFPYEDFDGYLIGPNGNLYRDDSGDLFGTTFEGGANYGTVYR